MKITQRTVQALGEDEAGTIVWDDALRGFGVRVNRNLTMSYIVHFRIDGKQRKSVIGRTDAIKAEEARRRARVLIGAASNGDDVIGKKQEVDNAPTFTALAERFIDEYIPYHLKPSTAADYHRSIKNFILPKLKNEKVDQITRQRIAEFHQSMAHTPYQANRVLGTLSIMLTQAEVWGMRAEGINPCLRVKRFKEHRRERFLSSTELGRLADALEEEAKTAPVTAAAFRLLILTGCRLGEIQKLEWRDVDLERSEIRLPEAKSKTGYRTVYLSSKGKTVLNSIPRLPGNPYVIHGRVPGRYLTDMQKPWRRIRKSAGIEDVRIHDLRHTFAANAASQGFSLPIIGKLLGHTQAQTTARYAHLAADPVRKANEDIARVLDASMSG